MLHRVNSINGGSFAVTACHVDSKLQTNEAVINWMWENESRLELGSTKTYLDFAARVFKHRKNLLFKKMNFLTQIRSTEVKLKINDF